MKITLEIWRQKNASDPGRFQRHEIPDVSDHMSFLEMMDVLNQRLIEKGEEPVAFDSDCREGICGMCGFVINGSPHGPAGGTVCQLHMRHFSDGDVLRLEPWRAAAFPVVKDLVVDRSAFDRVMQAGGYVSTRTGSAVDANAILVDKLDADRAMDYAACIGCGACVAACPNAAASLFVSAKISQLGLLPQGQPERDQRALNMIRQAQAEGFGHCTVIGECSAICPKEIQLDAIARANKDFIKAIFRYREPTAVAGSG